MPEALAAFIREYIAPPAPVAEGKVSRYVAWKPKHAGEDPPL